MPDTGTAGLKRTNLAVQGLLQLSPLLVLEQKQQLEALGSKEEPQRATSASCI